MDVLGKMRCDKCEKLLEKEDFVALSHIHTIFHLVCGAPPQMEGVKDAGTFGYILEKYPFMRNAE